MKKIVKRKGAGRRKGQVIKLARGSSLEKILLAATTGGLRKDVLRVYQHLRVLTWKLNLDGEMSRREAYYAVERMMGECGQDKIPEIFETLWVLLNAVRRGDVAFFQEFARTFELMKANDVAKDTIPSPPADLEFFWLVKLRHLHESEAKPSRSWSSSRLPHPARLSPPAGPHHLPDSLIPVLSLPLATRPPLTLDQIGDFLELRMGRRPSKSSISAKARIVGLKGYGQFGRSR
jgi:hypothetical protein